MAIFYKMQNTSGDNHSELVFKVCAKTGHLWPRCVLVLGGYATARSSCQKQRITRNPNENKL